MIPSCFTHYRAVLPMLEHVTSWTLLKKWELAEVYRVTLVTGETRIIKWGGSEMAGEADIYRLLVHPLQIKAPEIFEFVRLQESCVMIMEDAGEHNVEQRPDAIHFIEAARELATIRKCATNNLHTLSKETIQTYFLSQDNFLWLLDDLLTSDTLANYEVLLKLKAALPQQLERLYVQVPLTIVHHDYHAKNLLVQDKGIIVIDWSIAYLSPHLGDLYCLINEAHDRGNVTREAIISAYVDASDLQMEQLKWQLSIGGLCFLIKSLRWLVYGGTDIIPGSHSWIPDLMNDVETLFQELE